MASYVSVILPVFNSLVGLQSSLASVMSQTFTDWELLIVDDGSSDSEVLNILRKAQQHPRVRVIFCDENRGPAYARNLGLKAAEGKYVAFLDADDWWEPNKLKLQVGFMDKAGYDFSYHPFVSIRYKGSDSGFRPVKSWLVMPPCSTDWNRYLLTRGYAPCTTSMVRRHVISNYRFREASWVQCEDYVFFLELLRDGVIGKRLDHVGAVIRRAPGSRSYNKLGQVRAVWRGNLEFGGTNWIRNCFVMATYIMLKVFVRLRGR